MGGLESIAIKIVGTAEVATGNLRPLLHEIRHALSRLLATGEPSCVDLASLPLTPTEERALLDVLGRGEIEVKLDSLGPSTIYETAYDGVWVVTHRNLDDQVMTKFIEITFVPEIIKSHAADVQLGLDRLQTRLEGSDRP